MSLQQKTNRAVRRDSARNETLIVSAAREVISESGTESSIEQVASRAGVGVVYRHFANKEPPGRLHRMRGSGTSTSSWPASARRRRPAAEPP